MLKPIIRVGLGFLAAAAVVATVTVLPFVIWDAAEKIHGWRAVRNVVAGEAATLVFFYAWALKLMALFGVPGWLVLRWRRWESASAYAIGGALAAVGGMAAFVVALRPPTEGWLLAAGLWIALSGALGGVAFRWIARPVRRSGMRVRPPGV